MGGERRGVPVRKAVRAMRRAGWEVDIKRRTGELLCIDPESGRRFICNCRRKDITIALQIYLDKKGVLSR